MCPALQSFKTFPKLIIETIASQLDLLISQLNVCWSEAHNNPSVRVETPVHSARLPPLLLAGHGQLCSQPSRLLQHERQVREESRTRKPSFSFGRRVLY